MRTNRLLRLNYPRYNWTTQPTFAVYLDIRPERCLLSMRESLFRSVWVGVPVILLIGLGLLLQGCSTQSGAPSTPQQTPPTIASLNVSPANPSAVAGQGQQFTATGNYSNGSQQDLTKTASWSSSNTSISTIDASGMATTIQAGSTTIGATFGTVSGSTTLTVVAAAPRITSLTPNTGTVGTAVTISGTNFGATQGTSTVTFNGTAATATSWSATSIGVTVPLGATTGNAVVTVAGQASNGVSFTVIVLPPPSITSLAPNTGAPGTAVTINGANFGATQGSSTVTFNGVTATATSWSATSIGVTVPSGATSGNVVVTVAGQASNGVSFTAIVPPPSITSLTPNTGAVGTPVTISGANFGAAQGTNTVTFNGITATATSWSATSIAVTVPSGATTGNVVVTAGGQASNSLTFTVTQISVSVTPVRGGATTTQLVQLTATVTNDVGGAGVSWTVSSGGMLSGQTTNTTNFSSATVGSYTITATSKADNTKSASATLAVTNLAGVFTYHSDLARDGSNTSEYALTLSNVKSATFGKLFSCTADGAIYAQPLWVANLTINGAQHNVVFVATQHESLYAFDADASPCVQLWHVNLIDSAHGGTTGETSVPSGVSGFLVGGTSGDITPEVGVTGTPVIDSSTNTLYVVSKSVVVPGPTFFQRLHAIDLATGSEKFSGPVAISATYPGTGDGSTTDTFNPGLQNQRPGLALANGIVYIAWASHEDVGGVHPYYGWVIGYNASTLSQVSVLNVAPNVGAGGIWMGGGAPAADSSGNLYLITGNAYFDANSSTPPNNDYGDSFLQLSSGLKITSYFTPTDQDLDRQLDSDFGAGGSAVVLNLTSGTLKHLVIGGGKDMVLYLLNGDSMGGLGDANARQNFSIGSAIFATGAFWNNHFYIAGVNGPLLSYSFDSTTNLFITPASSQSAANFGFPGATPSVSANGNANGIVWALDNGQYCTNQSHGCGPAVLHAYDATNLATELWNSSQGTGNAAGNAVKFTVPTIANGKVYVGTRGNNTGGVTSSTTVPGELDVYGLLPH